MRSLKPYRPLEVHLSTLEQRGMTLNRELAAQWLANVGYYRLSGYWYPFRQLSHGHRLDIFTSGATIDDVVALYEFDRKLRTLVHDGVERVEIMLRTQLNEALGELGPMAYQDATHFRPTFDHAAWLQTVNRRINRARHRNDAVKHHDTHYGGQLPIWALSELLDFADVSRLYEGLPAQIQWNIAERLGVHVELAALSRSQRTRARKIHPLVRWFEQMTIVRNTSAHHARLWNRSFAPAGTAALRTVPELSALPEGQSERLYGALCVMGLLLETASPGTTWRIKVHGLVSDSFKPLFGRHLSEMGFPDTWCDDPFWTS
ncbi:Abi family protein [Corynebacterium sp. AOP40-9SA-29]|uniref:Abi family protein n=1 Tax=Corynebacterium sp. AOP40-9SA-29 TaxID=3457677 RepID=UPI004033BDE0